MHHEKIFTVSLVNICYLVSNCEYPLDYWKRKRVPEKHLLLLNRLCQSLWLCGSQLWKILQEMEILDYFACLLRNLYAGQEATVSPGHGTTDWFQLSKGVHQGCILSPWLFNLHAEYIRQNAGLDEGQAGIKIVGRNINNISPFDCKEIQPVNPKGNQSWIFIGRIDAETETPIVWPPDAKNWLTGKDPDAGKVFLF